LAECYKLIKEKEPIEEAGQMNSEIPIEEIFTENFMNYCSEYSSINEFLEDSGFVIEDGVLYDELVSAELDAFVKNKTSYDDWDSMFQAALEDYFSNT